jgi:hypothetical protein
MFSSVVVRVGALGADLSARLGTFTTGRRIFYARLLISGAEIVVYAYFCVN